MKARFDRKFGMSYYCNNREIIILSINCKARIFSLIIDEKHNNLMDQAIVEINPEQLEKVKIIEKIIDKELLSEHCFDVNEKNIYYLADKEDMRLLHFGTY